MNKSEMSDSVNTSRRKFLGSAAVVGSVTIAPGILLNQVANAKPADEAVTNDVRWGHVN